MRTSAMATGFVLMWSSGFIGATMGTRSAGALTLLMWRFLVAVLLLAGWWWLTRRRKLTFREIGVQAGIGLLSQGVYLFAVVWSAELGVSPGIAALVASLQPIAAAALERANPRQWIGLVIGLAGVALVVGGDLSTSPGTPPLAYALPFAAMLALVAASFIERKVAPEMPLADSLVIQCSTSVVLFTALAVGTGETTPPATCSFWFAVAWVVLLSTFGGYGFYWLNLRHGSVTRVSSLLYLTPPTTMVLAYLMFDEHVDTRGLLGLAVCLAAVLLVLRSPQRLSENARVLFRGEGFDFQPMSRFPGRRPPPGKAALREARSLTHPDQARSSAQTPGQKCRYPEA